MLRPQLHRGFKAAAKGLLRLVGQSGNQIQADVLETRMTCLVYERGTVVSRVQATDSTKFPVIKRLRADAQPVHAQTAQSAKQTGVCRAGSRFQREFNFLAPA